jgi:hypothetical protein
MPTKANAMLSIFFIVLPVLVHPNDNAFSLIISVKTR